MVVAAVEEEEEEEVAVVGEEEEAAAVEVVVVACGRQVSEAGGVEKSADEPPFADLGHSVELFPRLLLRGVFLPETHTEIIG